MEIDRIKLREMLLDRRIEAVKTAISGVRSAWLFATLLTFVLATVMFNATNSINHRHIVRRAMIVNATNGNLKTLLKAMAEPTDDGRLLKRVLAGEGTSELAYLKYLMPKKDSDALFEQLRSAAKYELQTHITRRVAFATVQIPLIGVSVAATDIGIVGGLGLAIVGYWMASLLRREKNAFGEFVSNDKKSGSFRTDHSGYSADESAYAYHSVTHYAVFCASTKGSPINFFTLTGYLLPPGLIWLNFSATIMMLSNRQGAGHYFEPHVLIEASVAVVVLFVWAKAFFSQLHTISALQAWKDSVEPKKNINADNLQVESR